MVPANNWPVSSLVVATQICLKSQTYVAITAFCGFCDKLPADRIFNRHQISIGTDVQNHLSLFIEFYTYHAITQ